MFFNEVKILDFVSKKPKTPFAPVWNYSILESSINSDIDLIKYKDLILGIEKETIAKYPYTSDWCTGLGPESLTSRSDNFNLLKLSGTDDLKKCIKKYTNIYLNALDIPNEGSYYVQCWANVMRKGEKINKHRHYPTNYCYLGGHITVQADNTSTHYENPYTYDTFSLENVNGSITIFPNWVEHHTDVTLSDRERITIAFDIINQLVFDEDIFDHKKNHWVNI